jgi:hypothetical protein
MSATLLVSMMTRFSFLRMERFAKNGMAWPCKPQDAIDTDDYEAPRYDKEFAAINR